MLNIHFNIYQRDETTVKTRITNHPFIFSFETKEYTKNSTNCKCTINDPSKMVDNSDDDNDNFVDPDNYVETPPAFTEVKRLKRSALKRGIVRDGLDSFEYLFVPKGWVPSDDSVDEVFKYLGLTPPTLVFRTMRCEKDFTPRMVGLRGDSSNFQVVYEDWSKIHSRQSNEEVEEGYNDEKSEPVTGKEKERFRLVMKSRIQDFLRILSKTCGKYGAYYLLDCASKENQFDDLILESLTRDGVAIVECDLWDKDHIHGWINDEERKWRIGQLKKYGKSLDEDVEKEVNWWPKTSKRIRHVIFFERKEERDEFRRLLMRDVPVGLLACGGHADNEETGDVEKLKEQLEYLRDGRPVICFRHAVGPAHCIVSLLDYIERRNLANEIQVKELEKIIAIRKRKLNTTKWNVLKNRLNIAEDTSAELVEGNNRNGEWKHKSLKELCFVVNDNDDVLDSYEVSSEKMLVQVENFEANIPRGFNRNAVMVFDPLKDNPSETMEDITFLMASIYSDAPEIGGTETEKWVIMHTKYEITRLLCLEKKERTMSWILKLLIFFFSFFSTLLSCTIELARKELAKSESNSTNGSSRFIQDLEAAMPFLEAATIILPVLLAISLTIYTTFSPRMRESKILLARAQVERLLYLYRLGVGKFRARIDEGPIHRQNFSMELKKILESVRDNELTKYSLVSNLASKSRVETILDRSSEWELENKRLREKLKEIERRMFGKKFLDSIVFGTNSRDNEYKKRLSQAWEELEGKDSHILLSDVDYIRKRIMEYLPDLDREVSSLSKQKRLLECSIIVLSAVTAIMAYFGGQLWIPVVLAFVTMLEGLVEFRHIPKRIETANITIGRLEETLFWWRGLGLMERMPANKERLVNEVEDAIMDRIFVIADSIRASETKSDAEHNNGSVSTGPRANQNQTTQGP